MKTPAPARPRFTCRVVRGWLAVFDDGAGGIPRGPGSGHVGNCADCQAFFGACDQLELALKRDAARAMREAPAGLEQAILRAVSQSVAEAACPPKPWAKAGSRLSPESQSGLRPPRHAWLPLAVAAACAVVAALVYQQRTQPGPRPEAAPVLATAGTTEPAMLAVARQIVAAVPTDLLVEMQPRAQAILRQDPLQSEVDAMKSDARTAVRFLARNFLPTPADEPTRGE